MYYLHRRLKESVAEELIYSSSLLYLKEKKKNLENGVKSHMRRTWYKKKKNDVSWNITRCRKFWKNIIAVLIGINNTILSIYTNLLNMHRALPSHFSACLTHKLSYPWQWSPQTFFLLFFLFFKSHYCLINYLLDCQIQIICQLPYRVHYYKNSFIFC